MRPETLPHPFAPAARGRILAWACPLSTFLLAAVLLFALAAVAMIPDANWPEGLLLLLATINTLTALARQLPSQNVMLAALIVAFMGSAVHAVGAKSGIPFGPFMY